MVALKTLYSTRQSPPAVARQLETATPCRSPGLGVPWARCANLMHGLRPGVLAAILVMAFTGCGGGGCKKDGDADSDGPIGQTCQANNAKYLCPTGYFCKYLKPEDMLNPKELGTCEVMEKYEPCMNTTLCGSADYAPKCETINETAYCDWHQTSLRCWCDKPGPFTPLAGEADGDDVKTPTTTK